MDKVCGNRGEGVHPGGAGRLSRRGRLLPDPQGGQAPVRHGVESYTLEYAEATLEVHKDAIDPATGS